MKIRYGEITKDVLLMLAIAGGFAVAATSPFFLINVTRAIVRQKKYDKKYKDFKEKVLAQSLSGLNKNKIIIIKEKEGKFTVELTEREGRQARNAMRWKLQKMGFFQLQKSVWVCPHPCEKEIQLVCEVFKINPFVNIVTAEQIYNDGNLKKYFKLY